MEYTHYGAGYGKFYDNKLLEEYNLKIGELSIIEPFNASEKLVNEILTKSLENEKDFYTNATNEIKNDMKKYDISLKNGVFY